MRSFIISFDRIPIKKLKGLPFFVAAMPVKTSKSFDFTIYSDDLDKEIEWIRSLEVSKITVGKEICPDTGRLHLQGKVTWKRNYSYAAVKKLHGKAHWEMTKCDQDNNYCRKRDAEPIIDIDNRKKKGQRTDIEVVKEVVRSSNSMRSVMEVATSVQSVRMAELWLKYNEPQRTLENPPEIHWRWGKPGVGKTRYVWEKHGHDVFCPISYKWWEGYDGHKVVLIDEFRADWCKFGELLKLLDRYPYRVESKGASRQIQANIFYITCCKPPENVYSPEHFDAHERIEQLTRRITSVSHIV